MNAIASYLSGIPLWPFEFIAVDAEIHRLFESILTTRKFGRKSRTDILNLYHSLQFMGLLRSVFSSFKQIILPNKTSALFPVEVFF